MIEKHDNTIMNIENIASKTWLVFKYQKDVNSTENVNIQTLK
jgi:hypothetical protein